MKFVRFLTFNTILRWVQSGVSILFVCSSQQKRKSFLEKLIISSIMHYVTKNKFDDKKKKITE